MLVKHSRRSVLHVSGHPGVTKLVGLAIVGTPNYGRTNISTPQVVASNQFAALDNTQLDGDFSKIIDGLPISMIPPMGSFPHSKFSNGLSSVNNVAL